MDKRLSLLNNIQTIIIIKMEKTYRKWTNEEESLLIKRVSESPGNIKKAIEGAARELGRSSSSCSKHWYSAMSNSRAVKKNSFLVIGSKTHHGGRKIYNTAVKNPPGLFRRIINAIAREVLKDEQQEK